ncbi:LysR family transcriptional regulator [Anaerovorax odorimutans]|uniref:LysR family transcriptional regulator n=1 Tax=Anaerovorax odorimutans TaxID=109327 RepID=UPI0003FC2EEF|nr:LysR family transcriptional regulator [Anaerovorax odorimutans]
MTIRHLKIFIAVYNENNMTTAANKLFMTQPSVSQAIKELENYYETILFERLSHKLYVTPAGKKVYQYAIHIIKLLDELEDNLKENSLNKNLIIGANYTVGTVLINKYMEKFNMLYPDSEIRVFVNNTSDLIKKLRENQLDFALVEEINSESDIVQEIFSNDRIVIVAHPEHGIFDKSNITALDIVNEHLLLREKGAGVRKLFETKMNELGFFITPFWESTSTTALINAAQKKLGIAVLPFQLVKKYIEAGSLKELELKEVDLKRHLAIVYHKNKYLNSTIKEFLKICHEPL